MHENMRNTDDSRSFRYKMFINFFWLLVFRHKERESQFLLCWLFHLTQQHAAHPVVPNWPGLARAKKSTCFVQRQISTNCFFKKSPKFSAHHFRAWRHSHPQSYSLSRVFIMTSVIVTSSACEHEYLHSMCAPACALSWIVLSLTIPNDKI